MLVASGDPNLSNRLQPDGTLAFRHPERVRRTDRPVGEPGWDLDDLVVTAPPGGLGGDDLMVSDLKGSAWTEPRLLPAPINSNEYEYGPWVADGWLYFTSHRGGNADIWRVKLSSIR